MIERLVQGGSTNKTIAEVLGMLASTIGRELKGNSDIWKATRINLFARKVTRNLGRTENAILGDVKRSKRKIRNAILSE